MRKIHCVNAISKYGTDQFTDAYELTGNLEEAEAILIRSSSLHETALPESLLGIARAGAGVNNIPLDKCAEQGVVVFNTPGANANAVKELVLTGMVLASRDIVGGIEWCKTLKEDPDITKDVEKGKKAFVGTEIRGKKLGIIGLGAIGVEVANAAKSLGMEVYGYDPFMSVNAAWMLSRSVNHTESIDDLYAVCDYITIHTPLTDGTKGMINKRAFDKMKDGVVILNYARDILVNEEDMVVALEEGKVKKYVTDFPNPLSIHMDNAIVTPHLGASTAESEENCAMMAVAEIMDYLENGNIRNSVNYPACDMGVCKLAARLAVLHKNVPNMIGQITGALAAEQINISDMTNKSKDKFAYTLMDLECVPNETTIEKLKQIAGVLRVRVIV